MKRYRILDIIRGITILSMIAYHTIWDLVYIFGWRLDWYHSDIAYLWQQSICWTFILLSGFCWSLGKKKYKRAIVVLLAGGLISGVTLIFMPENRVLFGVLTLLGSCMLLQSLLEPVYRKWNSIAGMLGSFGIFLICKNVNQGYLGIGQFKLCGLSQDWYDNLFTAFLGFPPKDFYSTDYFSFIPWYFLFLTGYFLYQFLKEKELLQKLPDICFLPFEWLGRKSLLLYMLHQPLVFAVLNIVIE